MSRSIPLELSRDASSGYPHPSRSRGPGERARVLTLCSRIGRVIRASYACYSIAFSPFYPNKSAVAGSANFGLVGNGRLSVLQDSPAGLVVEKA